MSPHEILGVSPMATREEIRAAYRKLARRWHPDRFMEGPERDWANDKMARINEAYHTCLEGNPLSGGSVDERHRLTEIEHMIDAGEYERARRTLMTLTTRQAEWNYLFGWVLMQLKETSKALIYLEVATHQDPASAKYAGAYERARRAQAATERRGWFRRR